MVMIFQWEHIRSYGHNLPNRYVHWIELSLTNFIFSKAYNWANEQMTDQFSFTAYIIYYQFFNLSNIHILQVVIMSEFIAFAAVIRMTLLYEWPDSFKYFIDI